MSESKESVGTGLILFVLGAAVGAVVVALSTPKSGRELRADLRDMGDRLRDRARHAGADLAAKMGGAAEAG